MLFMSIRTDVSLIFSLYQLVTVAHFVFSLFLSLSLLPFSLFNHTLSFSLFLSLFNRVKAGLELYAFLPHGSTELPYDGRG